MWSGGWGILWWELDSSPADLTCPRLEPGYARGMGRWGGVSGDSEFLPPPDPCPSAAWEARPPVGLDVWGRQPDLVATGALYLGMKQASFLPQGGEGASNRPGGDTKAHSPSPGQWRLSGESLSSWGWREASSQQTASCLCGVTSLFPPEALEHRSLQPRPPHSAILKNGGRRYSQYLSCSYLLNSHNNTDLMGR